MKIISAVVLGNSGVGKSTMLSRIVDNVEMREHFITIGTDIFEMDVMCCKDGRLARMPTKLQGKYYRLKLYDTGGDPRFQQIADTYVRRFKMFVICFKQPTEIHRWLAVIQRYHKIAECMIVLIAMKSDLRIQNKAEFQLRYIRETNRYLASFLFFDTCITDQRHVRIHIILETLIREYILNRETDDEYISLTEPFPRSAFCFCL